MELERSVELSNKYGLHARASTRLAQLAKGFGSDVRISREDGDEKVDAKSILGLLTLGAEKGQTIRIHTCGEDAEEAMEAIIGLFERNFEEE